MRSRSRGASTTNDDVETGSESEKTLQVPSISPKIMRGNPRESTMQTSCMGATESFS
jgi:hypothetical protein